MNDVQNFRAASTQDIRRITIEAIRLDLDQRLVLGSIKFLDPMGYHVLNMMLPDHQADPVRELPHYHRIEVLLKLINRTDPVSAILDIPEEHWESLPTLEEQHQRLEDEARLLFKLRKVINESAKRIDAGLPADLGWE